MGWVLAASADRWTMIRRFGLFLLTLPVAAAIPAVSAVAQYYSPPPPPYYRSAPPPGDLSGPAAAARLLDRRR